MLELTEEQLLRRGFKRNEWTDEGETFVEYVKQLKNAVKIEISGLTLIELIIEDAYETVNIDSLNELDLLIKMFE